MVEELQPRHMRAIQLMTHPAYINASQEDLATALGISCKTLYRWRQSAVFRNRLAQFQNFTFQNQRTQVDHKLLEAIHQGDVRAMKLYYEHYGTRPTPEYDEDLDPVVEWEQVRQKARQRRRKAAQEQAKEQAKKEAKLAQEAQAEAQQAAEEAARQQAEVETAVASGEISSNTTEESDDSPPPHSPTHPKPLAQEHLHPKSNPKSNPESDPEADPPPLATPWDRIRWENRQRARAKEREQAQERQRESHQPDGEAQN